MKFFGVVLIITVFSATVLADNPNANDEIVRYDNENPGGLDGYKFA